MNEINLIYLFFGFMVLLSPLYFIVDAQSKKKKQKLENDFLNRGYTFFDAKYPRQMLYVTYAYGKFKKSVPLFLQISNFSPLDLAMKISGINQTRIGDSEFDSKFSVYTNMSHILPAILTPDIRKELIGCPNFEYITGSYESLLIPDYWPKDKSESQARNLWRFTTAKVETNFGIVRKFVDIGIQIEKSIYNNIPTAEFEAERASRATYLQDGSPWDGLVKLGVGFCIVLAIIAVVVFIVTNYF